MNRDPSIHTKLSDLCEFMRSYGLSVDSGQVLRYFAGKQPKNREIKRTAKQKQRTDEVDLDFCYMCSEGLSAACLIKKIPMPQVKPGSPNWWVIEKIAHTLKTSENILGPLDKQAVIALYNKILKKGLKLKDLPKSVTNLVEDLCINIQLETHPYKQVVETIAAAYINAVRSKRMIDLEQTIKMGDFMLMVDQAVEIKADPFLWIQAQFDAFKAFQSLPSTSQLHGDSAYQRFINYTKNDK